MKKRARFTLVYDVVITKGRIGFPKGVWTTLSYEKMAEAKVRELRNEGITAYWRERVERETA